MWILHPIFRWPFEKNTLSHVIYAKKENTFTNLHTFVSFPHLIFMFLFFYLTDSSNMKVQNELEWTPFSNFPHLKFFLSKTETSSTTFISSDTCSRIFFFLIQEIFQKLRNLFRNYVMYSVIQDFFSIYLSNFFRKPETFKNIDPCWGNQ